MAGDKDMISYDRTPRSGAGSDRAYGMNCTIRTHLRGSMYSNLAKVRNQQTRPDFSPGIQVDVRQQSKHFFCYREQNNHG